jgi:hypothetical protein
MNGGHDPDARREKISGLIDRYRLGELSEVVFTASLKAAGMRPMSILELVDLNRAEFMSSRPYKRGDVS